MFLILKEKMLDFFFPESCLFCKKGEKIVCEECFLSIPQNILNENNILFIYNFKNEKINKLIWRLKYHHTKSVAEVFGKVLAKSIEEKLLRNFSSPTITLIPIPLSKNDKRINSHTVQIAEEIKNNLNLKVEILTDVLVKSNKIKQAHTKNRLERFKKMENAFSVSPNSVKNFTTQENNIYVIIDDVYTTGATINEARKVLSKFLNIPSNEIQAMTIAH